MAVITTACNDSPTNGYTSLLGQNQGIKENRNCNYIEDYYPLIYTAEVEYYLRNYQRAFDLYRKAFKACEPKNTPLNYEMSKFAELATRLGKSELALDLIERTLRNGTILKTYENDSLYYELLQSERGEKLVQDYESIREEYLTGLNLELRKEIQEMTAADQMYRRSQANFAAKKELVDSIDEVHEKRLIEIIEEFGYPDEKLIGGFAVDWSKADIVTLVLHTDDSIRMNYFVPKFKEFVKEGTIPPLHLGVVVDQYYNYNGEPQIYGTYSSERGGYATMIDREMVDRNRRSIGLPPLTVQEKLDSLKGY